MRRTPRSGTSSGLVPITGPSRPFTRADSSRLPGYPAPLDQPVVAREVPLPGGQCMLARRVEARLLQDLRLAPHESVLEIGAGSGYMAALMAHQALRVTTLEIRPTLAAMARANLQRAGIDNADVIEADGAAGQPARAPFDAIALSGSVAEVPPALLAQLKSGGRLIAIVGQLPVMRAVLVTRVAEQQYKRVELFDTAAPRLEGFGEPKRFQF